MTPHGRRPRSAIKTYGRNNRTRFNVFRDDVPVSEDDVKCKDPQQCLSPTKTVSPEISNSVWEDFWDMDANDQLTKNGGPVNPMGMGRALHIPKASPLTNKSTNQRGRANAYTTPSVQGRRPTTPPPTKKQRLDPTMDGSLVIPETPSPLQNRGRMRRGAPPLEDQDFLTILSPIKSKPSSNFRFPVGIGSSSSSRPFHKPPKYSGIEDGIPAMRGERPKQKFIGRAMEAVNDTTRAAAKFLPLFISPTKKRARVIVKERRASVAGAKLTLGMPPHTKKQTTRGEGAYDEIMSDSEDLMIPARASSSRKGRNPSSLLDRPTSSSGDGRGCGSSVVGDHEDFPWCQSEEQDVPTDDEDNTNFNPIMTSTPKGHRYAVVILKKGSKERTSNSQWQAENHEDGFDADGEMCTEDDNDIYGTQRAKTRQAINKGRRALGDDFDFDAPDNGCHSNVDSGDLMQLDDGSSRKRTFATAVLIEAACKDVTSTTRTSASHSKFIVAEASEDELCSNRYRIGPSPVRKTLSIRAKKAARRATISGFSNYDPNDMEIDELQWDAPEHQL